MVKSRTLVSAILITVMVASVFCLPVLTNNKVDAAPKKVKIKWNANGGKIAKKKTVTSSINKGKKIGKLKKATRSGYTFKGWYTKKTKGKKVTKNTKTKKSITLYARWTINSYTVTFNVSDGTVSPTSKKIKYNSPYGKLPNPVPTKLGHVFLGWETSDGKVITEKTIYNNPRNITLYAKWDTTLEINHTYLKEFNNDEDDVKTRFPKYTIQMAFNRGSNIYRYYRNSEDEGKGIAFVFKNDKCVGFVGPLSRIMPNMPTSGFNLNKMKPVYGNPANEYLPEVYFYKAGPVNFMIEEDSDLTITNYHCIVSTLPGEEMLDIWMGRK